jgi:serralysin
MATLQLFKSNSNAVDPGYYEDDKIEKSSSGWFSIDDSGVVYGQLSGNGVTYDAYGNPVLGTITGAQFIDEEGDAGWKISGIGINANSTNSLDYAIRDNNAFSDYIVGTLLSSNDTIIGSSGDDNIWYSTGRDVVNGGGGIDTMYFSDYNYNYYTVDNSLIVDLSLNYYQTTQTNNIVLKSSIFNVENISGSSGNDRITGNSLSNRLFGGDGSDMIYGGGGNDYIDSGRYDSGYDNDQAYGQDGNDTIVGSNGNTYIDGGSGVDQVTYRWTNNAVSVDLSANVGKHGSYSTYYGTWQFADTLLNIENVTGSAYNDTIIGNGGNNTICGGAGNDVLNGGAGVDTADFRTGGYNGVNVNLATGKSVGQGTDSILNFENVLGSNYNDVIIGNAGSNRLDGSGGNDTLKGDNGNDLLNGAGGNDVLYGGLGVDSLAGGGDADRFVFDSALNATTNKDIITDFVHGTDKIVLDDDIFTKIGVPGILLASSFRKGASVTTAGDADDRIILNTTTGALYYDANGSAAGAAVQFATLTGTSTKTTITASDFLVVA